MIKKSVAALALFVFALGTFTGCRTPLLGQGSPAGESDQPGFFHQTYGSRSGMDDRAREIEKSLGI